MEIYSKIIATGSYLPEKKISNADLVKLVATSEAWIEERCGITSRRCISEGESVLTMAHAASEVALSRANLSAKDIDLIIFATTTPDTPLPSCAGQLQYLLGSKSCPAFDINAACSGFVYALSIADKFIRGGTVKHALVVGSDAMTTMVDWSDRNTCILFGDGCGALVLSADNQPGMLASYISGDGKYLDLLKTRTIEPNDQHVICMQGRDVFKHAVKILQSLVPHTLEMAGLTTSDVDWLIPHQANIRIIKATADLLKLPMERVIVTLGEHGNTSAASIPLAMDHAYSSGKFSSGDNLLLEAFGAGFTWGSVLIKA